MELPKIGMGTFGSNKYSATVAAAVLLGVFVPVHGAQNDGEYWSEYDVFDVSKPDSIEVEGDEFKILQLTDLHYHLPHKTKETDNIVKTLVAENDPDMIVITGDSVFNPSNVMYTKHVAKLTFRFQRRSIHIFQSHYLICNHYTYFSADMQYRSQRKSLSPNRVQCDASGVCSHNVSSPVAPQNYRK